MQPETPTDEGRELTLEQLIQRHREALWAFMRLNATGLVSSRESISDLVQTVFLALVKQGEGFEFRGDDAFRSWLFTTAQNKLRARARYHRRHRRNPELEERLSGKSELVRDEVLARAYRTVHSASQAAIAREEIERMERCFSSLPETYRHVITMSRFARLPYAEIGEQMGGKSSDAVRMLLGRALARLAVLLEED